jgi:hypothetical protein
MASYVERELCGQEIAVRETGEGARIQTSVHQADTTAHTLSCNKF